MQKKRIIFSYLKSPENAAEKKTKYNKKNVHFVWKKCTFRFADYRRVLSTTDADSGLSASVKQCFQNLERFGLPEISNVEFVVLAEFMQQSLSQCA